MRECDIVVQFCLAHLIRDIKFLTTLPGAAEKGYGERLRTLLRELFQIIHAQEDYSESRIPETGTPAAGNMLSSTLSGLPYWHVPWKRAYRRRLEAKRNEIVAVGTNNVPDSQPCQAMAKRLRKHGAAYFTFITTPGIEPTNNLAEQAIRFVVIDRHITQGTRSEGGNRSLRADLDGDGDLCGAGTVGV